MGSRHYNYAKVKCITAARAAGITVVHGVTLAVSDHEACRRVAQMGARMGFDGKLGYTSRAVREKPQSVYPTTEEIARANHIVEEYEK